MVTLMRFCFGVMLIFLLALNFLWPTHVVIVGIYLSESINVGATHDLFLCMRKSSFGIQFSNTLLNHCKYYTIISPDSFL
jgi:hypothetical protein